MLAVVWAGAGLGILRALVWPRAPRALATALYLLLGWAAVPLVPAMYRALGGTSLALLAAGGILYSVGAVIYATRRPDPFPRIFGYHEIFHALVIAAAGLHFAVAAGAVRALGQRSARRMPRPAPAHTTASMVRARSSPMSRQIGVKVPAMRRKMAEWSRRRIQTRARGLQVGRW
jgi:hypothetical protein